MLLVQLFNLVALLAGPIVATLLAGNENYAALSRSLRRRNALQRRTGPGDLSTTSVSFSVGDGDDSKQYLSPIGPKHKSYTLSADWGLDDFPGQTLAVTVFSVEGQVTCDVLGKQLSNYAAVDDVWDQAFMQAIVLQSNSSYHVTEDVTGCLKGWGGSLLIKSGEATSNVTDIGIALVSGSTVPPGPYLAIIDGNITLTEMYRVYRDENQAFVAAIVPTTDGNFAELTTSTPGMNTLSIPVPSRLYTLNLPNPRPLEGRRVAVKDIFDIAGLKTGCGNRAYYNTYPAREVHSYPVQRLVDQGAILVGKAKTSTFANGETATGDWVDQMCPYNPRADGYQQPSSSSSGPGAAMAAYDWLDNTVGSDTGCSVLCPSSANGVFGMRPTWGRLNLTGVMPMAPAMDTAGFFSRDAVKGRDFSKGWYGDLFETYTTLPKTLIFPEEEWTFSADSPAAPIYNAFRDGITQYINPTTIDNRSFDGFWNDTGMYAQTGNETTADYLADVWGTLVDYGQWTTFGEPWFEDYASANEGRLPFVAPSPNTRWSWGRVNLTVDDYTEAERRKGIYKEWIIENVLVPDNETCSKTIYLAPYNDGSAPAYRNLYLNPPSHGFFSTGVDSFMAGNPQMMLPIGQVPYLSDITNHTEYIPVTLTMYAAPGCDYLLWDIAAALQESGVLAAVTTGRIGFST